MISSSDTRLVFFVPEWPATSNGVLQSQVLSVARYLTSIGISCLFVGCDGAVKDVNVAADAIRKDYSIDVFLSHEKNQGSGFFEMRATARKVSAEALALIKSFKPTHVYSRSVAVAPFARAIANQCGAVSVLDVRAALSEEVKERRGDGLRYRVIRYLERREIRLAGRVACVSENLKLYLKSFASREDVTVIPSCVDPSKFRFDPLARQAMRLKLGVGEAETLYCYVGGLAEWQRVDDIVRLFKSISQISTSCRFIFVTNDLEGMSRSAASHGLDSSLFSVLSARQDEVYRYLSASDIGVIMRYDNILNNVSSPIKLGEYLQCDLPVILTTGIGDFSCEVVQSGAGVIVEGGSTADASHVLNFIRASDMSQKRRAASKLSKTRFLLSSYRLAYLDLYRP